MRRNFILLTATTILSMVVPSHTNISFPQIASSELIKPYCNATCISEVFPHDVIPFQSCAPFELTRDTLYCEATSISESTKNMYCAGGATTKSCLDIASDESPMLDGFLALISLMLIFGMLVFYQKAVSVEDLWKQCNRGVPMNNYIGSSMSSKSRDLRKVSDAELLLTVLWIVSRRRSNAYLYDNMFQ